jgi:hypothetical protein
MARKPRAMAHEHKIGVPMDKIVQLDLKMVIVFRSYCSAAKIHQKDPAIINSPILNFVHIH